MAVVAAEPVAPIVAAASKLSLASNGFEIAAIVIAPKIMPKLVRLAVSPATFEDTNSLWMLNSPMPVLVP